MSIKQQKRRIEVHRLTISGLEKKTEYSSFIKEKWSEYFSDLKNRTFRISKRYHVLNEVVKRENGRLKMRFFSYKKGYRPDIIDTKEDTISSSPLSESQTGIHWTHCLGGLKNSHYFLLVEKFQGSIGPKSIEDYIQQMLNQIDTNIVVSLEAEPGERFLQKLNSLSTIRKATYRKVRPNPGWADLNSELAKQSEDSDAHNTDVTMTAKRYGKLNPNKGIVEAIKIFFSNQELDFANIEGKTRNGKIEKFNTSRLCKAYSVDLELDSQEQVDKKNAWEELNLLFDEI